MRYIFQNIRITARKSPAVFIMYVLSCMVSVVVVMFSHGVYQNYSTDTVTEKISGDQSQAFYSFGKPEEELKNGDTVSYVSHNSVPLSELRQVIDELSDETKSSFTGFFVHFSTRDHGLPYDTVAARLEYNSELHKYGLYSKYLDNIHVSSGRYITPDEEYEGKNVAVIRDFAIGDSPAFECEAGESITLFGKTYQVIGTFNETDVGFTTIDVPFGSLPDDMPVVSVYFLEGKVITTQAFSEINDTMRRVFGDNVNIPVMQTADTSETKFYTTIVIISVVLSVIAAITLMILFRYIVFTRRKTISVLRLSGCTRSKAALMLITEAVGVSGVIYVFCALLYHLLILPKLTYFFPKIAEVYSLTTYIYIFAVFIVVLLITMAVMVFVTLDKQPVDMLRRAGVG